MAFPSLSPLKRLCLFLAVVAGIVLGVAHVVDEEYDERAPAVSGK